MPNMEWDDACQDIAHNFYKIEKSIESYINEHYSVLPEEIVSKINSAKNSNAEGKFEEPEDLKSYQLADNLWKRIDEAINELKNSYKLLLFEQFLLIKSFSQKDLKFI